MSRFFQKDVFKIGVSCVFLWCLTVTSTWQTDILIPNWMRHIPDENQTGVPKSLIQLQNTLLYPTRRLLQTMFSSQRNVDKARMLQRTQRRVLKSTKPFCSTNGTRSSTRPTSVHELRPGDVDIIGSVGDSLTVGTGSFSNILPQLVVDHRGTSWTAGGQGTWKEFLTLPNILKVFNPKLIGYAYGDSLAEESFSQFNVAEVGALSRDIPFMTKELVKRIKMDKRVNLNEDWKLITIMMGSNTFCLELCYEDYTKYPDKHREEVLTALLYLKENLPRTIVNLVLSPINFLMASFGQCLVDENYSEINNECIENLLKRHPNELGIRLIHNGSLDLEILLKFKNLPMICFLTHIAECPCLYAKQYEHKLADYIQIMKKFQEVEKEIMDNEELKNKEDFTVVLQTFTEHLKFPVNRFNSTDVSYLASDCFHFSQKGYARAANALWNNMMEPVGRKSTDWSKEFDRFHCPTDESPYIRTWKNSMT